VYVHSLSLGLREELLGWDVHEGDSLAHYARACTDVTFRFPFGTQELMGIAARGNFDLTSHSEGSGKSEYKQSKCTHYIINI
jgi:glycyl-tRNA synthetase